MKKSPFFSKRYRVLAVLSVLLSGALSNAHADLPNTPFIAQTSNMTLTAAIAIFSGTPELLTSHGHLTDKVTDDQAVCLREQGNQLSHVLKDKRFEKWFGKMGLNRVSIELVDRAQAENFTGVYFDQENGTSLLTIMIQRDPKENCDLATVASADRIETVLKSEARQLISSYQKDNQQGIFDLEKQLTGFPEIY